MVPVFIIILFALGAILVAIGLESSRKQRMALARLQHLQSVEVVVYIDNQVLTREVRDFDELYVSIVRRDVSANEGIAALLRLTEQQGMTIVGDPVMKYDGNAATCTQLVTYNGRPRTVRIVMTPCGLTQTP